MPRGIRDLLLSALLIAVAFCAYWPAVHAGFIWNDSDYVTAPSLRSLAGLQRIWFELGATEQYYPLLHSAFWVQHKLWGDSPTGYHVLNILLHAGCGCLLAAVLRRLAIPGAWLAAFVFVLHPVTVESVAWISEQKNTLSLLFFLAAALVYLRFERHRERASYAIATVLFVFALLSKSVTATLPAVLLVVGWWKRGRLDWRRDVLPLVPWLILGAAMGLVSAWVEKTYIGAEGAEFALTFLQRCLLAGRIVWFYLGKLLWPGNLIFIYPRWTVDPTDAAQWLFSLAVVLGLVVLWVIRTRWRGPLATALIFGGCLFPTLGFFNVYAFRFSFVADHWQYLPCIAMIVIGSAGLAGWWASIPGVMRTIGPVVLVTALGLLTLHQSRMYADVRTFYRTTLQRNPSAWMAHNNLGNLLREDGKLDEARTHLEAAVKLRPDLEKAQYNLGNVLRDQRQPAAAADRFRRAIALHPDYPDALNSLGTLLREQRQLPEAIELLTRAVRVAPTFADARHNLGMALRDAGRNAEAIEQFQEALRLQPWSAPAHLNLALTFSLMGRTTEAAEHFREARRLNPAIPDVGLE